MSTILVVSNDSSVCSFFKRSLSGDYIVHTARTSEEALQIFLEIDIEVVFLDIFLNEGGANTLLEELQQINIDPTVVMIIPGSQPILLEEAFKIGAYELLGKPLKKEAIQHVAKKALEKQELKRELCFIQSQIKI